jgi:hypothetical protein
MNNLNIINHYVIDEINNKEVSLLGFYLAGLIEGEHKKQ